MILKILSKIYHYFKEFFQIWLKCHSKNRKCQLFLENFKIKIFNWHMIDITIKQHFPLKIKRIIKSLVFCLPKFLKCQRFFYSKTNLKSRHFQQINPKIQDQNLSWKKNANYICCFVYPVAFWAKLEIPFIIIP